MLENRQTVNINADKVTCSSCGAKMLELGNFKFINIHKTDPSYTEELCVCKNCEKEFIIRYDIFDDDGHIQSRVFTGDINDPRYNWQDSLTEEQKSNIASHIKDCQVCIDRLSEEQLMDARFSSIIHNRG